MTLANKKMRARIEALLNEVIANEEAPAEYKEAAQAWIAGKDDAESCCSRMRLLALMALQPGS